MDEQRQVAAASTLAESSFVIVTWTLNGGVPSPWFVDIAQVSKSNGRAQLILQRDINTRLSLPSNDQDEYIIKEIVVAQRPDVIAPFSLRRNNNINIRNIRFFIYCDGGTTYSAGGNRRSGASAAAIYVIDRVSGAVATHARYYNRSNNDVMEWIAIAGAIQFAKSLDRDEQVLIITDYANSYNALAKADRPRNAVQAQFYDLAKQHHCDNFSYAHMHRDLDNPADDLVKMAKNNAQNIADGDKIFADAPHEPDAPPAPGRQARVEVPDVSATVDAVVNEIIDIEAWAKTKRFNSRSRCPRGYEAPWSQIVRQQLTRIIAAGSKEARRKALIGFLLLPKLFLPTRGDLTRLHRHLVDGQAFKISVVDNPDRPKRATLNRRTDLDRRVEQMCNDFRLKQAVKIMQTNAEDDEQPRLVFEDVVAALDAKFPQREEQNEFPPEPTAVVRPFTAQQVFKIVKKMSKSAATAVDGWTRDLLMAAMMQDGSIAPDLGTVLAQIASSHGTEQQQNNMYFDELSMDILRTARLVGIPKPDGGGVRPIVVSSFIAKMLGALLLERANIKQLAHQFAIGTTNGAHRIVHRARDAYARGKVIIRLDSVNAFNITKRCQVLQQLKEENFPPELITYFSTMYQPTSKMVIYGPDGQMTFIDSSEGLRQGDALSAFYFCLVMRKVCVEIAALFPMLEIDDIMCFMDDSTFIVPPEIAHDVLAAAVAVMRKYGFRINTDKSAMICKNPIPPRVTTAAAESDSDAESAESGADDCSADFENKGADVPPPQVLECDDAHHETDDEHEQPVGEDAAAAEMQQPHVFPDVEIEIVDPSAPFKMLGAIINDNHDDMNAMVTKRLDKFFDGFDKLDVHPEMKHNILHMCGKPKLIYYASTTPPQYSAGVTQHFDRRCKQSFAALIGKKDASSIDDDLLHDEDAGNIPDYFNNREALYINSVTMAATAARQAVPVRLTTNSSMNSSSSLEAGYDSCWTRYIHASRHDQLKPAIYTCALAIRCWVIPDGVHDGRAIRCNCGVLMQSQKDIIQHALRCEKLSHISPAVRHTMLKSALAIIARVYGIGVSVEPNDYVYTDNIAHRPDLTFYTGQCPVVTDVTVVSPTPAREIGHAATLAADAKHAAHYAAAARAGHEFIAFAMETNGHFDGRCFQLFDKIANYVASYERHWFKRDIRGAASTAIAQFRAQAVRNACYSQLDSALVE
jgi:ribonuclease HI